VADGLVFSALSVNSTAPGSPPTTADVKLMLKLQLPPGASAKLLVQSAGVPEPATWTKKLPNAPT
jgi:hypothetical protein